jgi:glycosyltransferase involved in cell wall biosynthesis
MKIVSLIEATTINAVAKGAIEFLRTARELAQRSEDFPQIDGSFVTFARGGSQAESSNEFVASARNEGIEVDIVTERRRFDLNVIPALKTIVEQRLPDLVVTHSVKSHFLMWRSDLGKKVPWLAFHHGYTTTDRKMRLYNRLDRWSLPKADQLLTVCHAFARELSGITKIPTEQILVQHNAIRPKPQPTPEAVKALKDNLSITADERVVLSVGRLSKEKAHGDLIAAFMRLGETRPDLNSKLVIVGDGPERHRLESTANGSREGERIVFAGQVNDVQPFYAMADVFVLPSHREGSPNALLEAMAAGVPVVATAVGGVPEIVSNGESALVVPSHDPRSIAEAIARALTDNDLRQRVTAKAAELIATVHAPETYVSSLIEIYSSVVNQRHS